MADKEPTETPSVAPKAATPNKPKRAPAKLGKKRSNKTPPTSEINNDDETKSQEIDKEVQRGGEGDSDFYQIQEGDLEQNQQEEQQQQEKMEPEPEPELEQKHYNHGRRRPRPARSYRQESEAEPKNFSETDDQPQPQQLQRTRRQRQPHQRLKERESSGGNALQGMGDVDQAGQLVQNTAGKAVNGVTDSAGKALGGALGDSQKEEKEDSGNNEQLRLRLDINLDIEIELKAKIHGDLTIGLLSVSPSPSTNIYEPLECFDEFY